MDDINPLETNLRIGYHGNNVTQVFLERKEVVVCLLKNKVYFFISILVSQNQQILFLVFSYLNIVWSLLLSDFIFLSLKL